MFFHTQDIRHTYWQPASKLMDEDRHNGPKIPMEWKDGFLRRLWPDTVICPRAVVAVEDRPGTELVLEFRSGVRALEVFRSVAGKRALLEVLPCSKS